MTGYAWATVVGMAMMAAVGVEGQAATDAKRAVDPQVLQLREAAWRAWFSGDAEALMTMLPADFIGISATAGPITTREVTVQQSLEFHGAGDRLVSLEFPETHVQQDGEVVVLYGRYRIVVDAAGSRRTSEGRLTEMFVKRKGTWVHTGWHLDSGGSTP